MKNNHWLDHITSEHNHITGKDFLELIRECLALETMYSNIEIEKFEEKNNE